MTVLFGVGCGRRESKMSNPVDRIRAVSKQRFVADDSTVDSDKPSSQSINRNSHTPQPQGPPTKACCWRTAAAALGPGPTGGCCFWQAAGGRSPPVRACVHAWRHRVFHGLRHTAPNPNPDPPRHTHHTHFQTGPGVDESGNGAVTFPNVGQGGCLHVRILRVPIQIKVRIVLVGSCQRVCMCATLYHAHTHLYSPRDTGQIKSAWIDHTELRVEAPPSAPALEVTEEAGSTTTRGEPGAVVVSDAKLGFAPNALLGKS